MATARLDPRRAGWLLPALDAFLQARDEAEALAAVRAVQAEDPDATRLTLATRLAVRRLSALSLRPGLVILRPALREALLARGADPAALEALGLLAAEWEVLADIALLYDNRSGRSERALELLTVMALGLGELELARELDQAHLQAQVEPVDAGPLARRLEKALAREGRLVPASLLVGLGATWLEARATASLAALWFEQAAVEEEGVRVLLELSRREKEELFQVLVEVAWADGQVAPEERRLIEQRLSLARLDEAGRRRVRERLDARPVAAAAPGRLDRSARRFVLEQAILLTLVDEEQHPDELQALQGIARRLGGSAHELEETLVEVAAFCEQHRALLQSFGPVSGALGRLQRLVRERAQEAVKKNAGALLTEVKETGELARLLAAASVRRLTRDETRRVQQQLLDVARTIPALAIFALPGGALLLPILIKVLPWRVLPSAFADDAEPGSPLA